MALSELEFNYIRKLVHVRSGIVLEPGKEYLVESRIAPILGLEGFGDFSDLVRCLEVHPENGLHEKVVEAMTTNETSFFRDIRPFEILRDHVLPELLQRLSKKRQLNIWCGASSSGQEPYSLAILLKENFPQLANWNINFIATDISSKMLERCRQGIYTQLEVNRGLSAPLLVKYFEREGIQWIVKKSLRGMIQFQKINLCDPLPPMPSMDIVFLRNVLIYFDLDTKKKILEQVRHRMHPEGYLFLGAAESTINLNNSYERLMVQQSGCYQLKR